MLSRSSCWTTIEMDHYHCEHIDCEQEARCISNSDPVALVRSPEGPLLIMHSECAIQYYSSSTTPEMARLYGVWDKCRDAYMFN